MMSFGNLAGTFMYKDVPQIEFRFERGDLTEFNLIHSPNMYEFTKLPAKSAFLMILPDRVTPETRIGLQKDLEKAGISYYNFQSIIEYTHGFSIEDPYWIRLQGESLTWNDLLQQKGLRYANGKFY